MILSILSNVDNLCDTAITVLLSIRYIIMCIIEAFKENISGFIGFLIIVFIFYAVISFTEPADYMHVKIKLDALERNKDQLRRIVQDVVNEETKDNNYIDKEKVKKITTTLIVESLILDDEKN